MNPRACALGLYYFRFGCGFVMILDLGARICDVWLSFWCLVILGCVWFDPCGHLVFGRHPMGAVWVELARARASRDLMVSGGTHAPCFGCNIDPGWLGKSTRKWLCFRLLFILAEVLILLWLLFLGHEFIIFELEVVYWNTSYIGDVLSNVELGDRLWDGH